MREGEARQSLHFHDDRHDARVWLEPDEGSPRRGDAHDLRRTFVTGMVELHVPPHVVELVVNPHFRHSRASPRTREQDDRARSHRIVARRRCRLAVRSDFVPR